MMQAGIFRLVLFVFLIAMYVIAMTYLRRRRLSVTAYAFWGLFALTLPALGPFLVIVLRPGSTAAQGHATSPTDPSLHKENTP